MPRRPRVAILLGIAISSMALTAGAADRDNPGWLLPMPEVDADPKVPTLKQLDRPRLGRGHLQPRRDRALPPRPERRRARPDPAGPLRADDREAWALLSGDHRPQEPRPPR